MCTHIRFRSAAALLAAATLPLVSAACEDTVAPQDDAFEEGAITIDASSQREIAYLSLSDGGRLLTSSGAAASTDWHLSFRRFGVRLNGGVSGPGSVTGANLRNNAALAGEAVAALSEAHGDSAFRAVTVDDVAGAAFVEDDVAADPGASWFQFDPRAGTVVANPGAAWKVRESSGRGHAVFRVSRLTMQGERPVGLVVEYRRQEPGGSLGGAGAVEVDLAQGPRFVGLAGGRSLGPGDVQGPAACAWDIVATPALAIDVNADCGAGTFPLDPTEDFTAVATAADAPKYGGFLSAVAGAFPATVNDASGIFWYDIEGNRRLWPTYNVFLVRAGEEVYKVQITSYYRADGTSGFPTVRFLRLR